MPGQEEKTLAQRVAESMGLSESATRLRDLQQSANSDTFNTLMGLTRQGKNDSWARWMSGGNENQNVQGFNDLFTSVGGNTGYNNAYDELAKYNNLLTSEQARARAGMSSELNSPSSLTGGVQELLKKSANPMGNVLEDYANQTISMGKSFIQGQMQEAGRQSYAKRQQILEVQRKYGITGAVANAQMQDFELKNREMLTKVANQSALQWYQTVGQTNMANKQRAQMAETNQIQGLIKQVVDKKITSASQLKKQFELGNIDTSNMKDEDFQNMIDNPQTLNTWVNANRNKYQELAKNPTDKK